MSNLLAIVLSGWCFFFRWPSPKLVRFDPKGILSGAFLQASVFWIFGFLLKDVLRTSEWTATFLSFVGLSLLTGLFHEDGLADTGDAMGVSKFDSSPETLERIEKAMKDSRLGSFGVSALILLWLARYTFAHHLSLERMTAVILLSRGMALSSAVVESRRWASSRNARSSHLIREIPLTLSWVVLAVVYIIGPAVWFLRSSSNGFAPLAVFFVACLGANVCCFAALHKLAGRLENLAGDLVGAVVCGTEILLGMLFCCLF